jgi:hypothetical protein
MIFFIVNHIKLNLMFQCSPRLLERLPGIKMLLFILLKLEFYCIKINQGREVQKP